MTVAKMFGVYAASILVLWALGGFICMDWDVSRWTAEGRLYLVALSIGPAFGYWLWELDHAR